jgi:mRNA interferase MazF
MSVFGQVIQVAFPNRSPSGHEQTGLRPALVVSDPTEKQKLESPMLIVAPITTQEKKKGVLRVKLAVGDGGLPEASTIMVDQLAAVDVSRVRLFYGRLTGTKLEEARMAVKTALADVFEET